MAQPTPNQIADAIVPLESGLSTLKEKILKGEFGRHDLSDYSHAISRAHETLQRLLSDYINEEPNK